MFGVLCLILVACWGCFVLVCFYSLVAACVLVWRCSLVCSSANCLFAFSLCCGLGMLRLLGICLVGCNLRTLRWCVFDLRLCCWCGA